MTDDDQISRIEAALEAGPTPGPWFVSNLLGFAVASIAKTRIVSDQAPSDKVEIDARFIAACNPTAIRALLDERGKLLEALTKANAQTEHFEREWYLRGDEIERLRDALHRISLGSQNSMESKNALGKIARTALENTDAR